MKKLLLILTVLSVGVSACGDTVINNSPGPTTPTTTPRISRIEFRVLGNASTARIRFSNTVDRLSQVTSALPYFISINTTVDSMFLFIDATPQSYPIAITNPFFSAQIIVNGELFREAVSNDFTFNTISASGTWRK